MARGEADASGNGRHILSASGRDLLLVIGVGRSGTSAFTGILREAGFHVPQPEVAADDTNPRGFSEPRWVVDFHTRELKRRRVTTIDSRPAAFAATAKSATDEAVLAELRSWLDVQFVGAPQVVIKDPRISWFLPLWRRCAGDLAATPSSATMLRPPTEVLASARQWYGTWQNDASRAAGWLNIMLRTEQQTRDSARVFVRYDALLADWRGQLARVGQQLDISRLDAVEPAAAERIDSFVDPQLRRQSVGWDGLDVPAPLRELVDRVWEAMVPLAEDGGDLPVIDALREEYEQLYTDAEAIAQSTIRAAKTKDRPAPATKPAAKAGGSSKSEATPSSRRLPGRVARRARRDLGRLRRRLRS